MSHKGRDTHIGRPRGIDMRELIIGRDARAYVAWYRYIVEMDIALSVRAQRETGHARP